MNPDTMARGLGMLSIGLGVTELLAARCLARSIGRENDSGFIRLMGAREIAQGVACLGINPPTMGVLSRVAGDALDIGALLSARPFNERQQRNVAIALAAVVGITTLDLITASWLREGRDGVMTRLARAATERLERRNERRMCEAEQRGVSYARSEA